MTQWQYTFYEDACRASDELHTQAGEYYPRCAICGGLCNNYLAHHHLISRRYGKAKNDVRDIVPMCSEKCHQMAHTKRGLTAAVLTQCEVLGEGDKETGMAIFMVGYRLWLPKTGQKGIPIDNS